MCNPDGSKQKRDAWVAVHKVLVTGLLESPPKEYVTNAMMQELIGAPFSAFVAVLKRDFKNAGLGILYPNQMSSLMLGHLVHNVYSSKQCGEKL